MVLSNIISRKGNHSHTMLMNLRNGNLPVETKNDIFVWKTDSSGYDCCMSNSRVTLLFY